MVRTSGPVRPMRGKRHRTRGFTRRRRRSRVRHCRSRADKSTPKLGLDGTAGGAVPSSLRSAQLCHSLETKLSRQTVVGDGRGMSSPVPLCDSSGRPTSCVSVNRPYHIYLLPRGVEKWAARWCLPLKVLPFKHQRALRS